MPAIFKWSSVAVLSLVFFAARAPGCDVEVAISNVPDKIVAALKAAFPTGKMISAEKRTIDKKLVHFDIEIKVRGKPAMDVYLDGDGKLLRTGVAIKAADVPEKVAEAFNKSYGEWHPTELYKETDYVTKAEVYSADIEKDGKTMEVDFAPDGSLVKALELKKDD